MELATLHDIERMKAEIINEVRKLTQSKAPSRKKWVKSKKARDMLGCSPGTLQNLRQRGTLIHSKVGGTLYYDLDSIIKELESNVQNGN